jgi:NADH-quinone oxidoreductase subunit N
MYGTMNPLLANIGKPYIPGWGDLGPFVAECWLIATIVAVLLTPFFTRRSNLATALVSLAGVAVAMVSLLYYGVTADATVQPLRGILVSDHVAVLWKAMLLFFTGGIILMWLSTTARTFHEGDGPEFFTLLLGATLGMCLMASTTNLLMIFMVVEMASLPSYVLAGFRKTHRLGAEASLKYVLFGAATSAIMAYGLSFLYGLYGTLDVAEIAQRINTGGAGSPALLTVALFGFIVGTGFKVSAVPFHFWCPDVFEGASIEVSAFLSVASKGAAVVLLLRVLMTVADVFGYQHAQPLTALAVTIGVIGAVTATVGNTAAFVQNNIKRLLAYSSIAHAGYMLCAISLLYNVNAKQTDAAGVNAPAGAILFYLAVYLFMNLGAFTVAAIVARATGSEDLSAFRGLVKRSPLLAHCMFAFMLSLVGLPPFAGFVAKFNVLMVLIHNGGWWWVLVAVIGLNTIASLYYYARVLKVMYLDESSEPAFVGHPLAVALSVVCAVTLVLMFIRTARLNDLTQRYSRLHNVTGAPRATPTPATQPATTRPTATASARTP